jgi:hypothetical protein
LSGIVSYPDWNAFQKWPVASEPKVDQSAGECALASQFIAEPQIVERNQHDPVRR